MAGSKHWKSVCGVELFKIEHYLKKGLFDLFGVTLPKLRDQRGYWAWRGEAYYEEITASGYLDREVFFQDLLMEELRARPFDSAFEAGCGFGWNVKRVKEEHPQATVGGLDFSLPQLANMRRYKPESAILAAQGDACRMPFADNAFDVGFTLGVFMNIHPGRIMDALSEMARVCRKRIIHMEWNASRATKALADKRAFKTNIVSHDYDALYARLGLRPTRILTHQDVGQAFLEHERRRCGALDRWEKFEGPDKYTLYVFDK